MLRSLGGRLWRDSDFRLLWAGQTVSEIGSQVTLLALPSAAILILHAGPFEVGVLMALSFLAFPTLGLLAGVLADRLRRRRIMIPCDLARLVILGSVPVSYITGTLSLAQLYVVGLLVGVFNVFFAVAYQSYLPTLVQHGDLVEGNSKLELSRYLAQVSGPALAGVLMQAVGAPRTILVDALSYGASAATLWRIRRIEPTPQSGTASGKHGLWAEMLEGIDMVRKSPLIWKTAGSTATFNLGTNILFAVYFLFAYNDLHLSSGAVGLAFAVGSVGGLLGAMSAGPIAERLGIGVTLLLAIWGAALCFLLVPLGVRGWALPLQLVAFFAVFYATPVYNVNQISLRQAITPIRSQGRINATVRTIVWGTVPVGALIGGALGDRIGIVPTLLTGAAVSGLAGVWILTGPVRLRRQPERAV